ncbi:MAG: protein translocase subunit SecF [Anaerolineae bacterium]|nr:protein translocase subunit SecF [Anaerolineae bacterium]
MFSIVQKRRLYFLVSAAVIIPGILIMLYSLATTGALMRLSIDFEGGSLYDVTFLESGADESNIRDVFTSFGNSNPLIQRLGDPDQNHWSIRAQFQEQAVTNQIVAALNEIAPVDTGSIRVETLSETVGQEATQAAFFAVAAAAVVVTGFIVLAFRTVPKALRYGICAIVAMLHDVLVVAGVMSLLGLLLGWEVDALFLTALLTVVGFSIQDTIVMFDRIRENIPRHLGEPYEAIVNRSILETMHRSLATQLNAFFIMIAIMLFGGESIRQFITILFIGLLTGTYSSIFIAVPLLVAWEKGELPFTHPAVAAQPSAAG